MDVNGYTLEVMVRDRLADLRARGEQSSLISAARRQSGRPPALARALGRLAAFLRGVAGSTGMAADAREAAASGRRPKHGAVRG